MIKKMITEYVHTMFQESRSGELSVGNADNRSNYTVDWDEQTAEVLANQCGNLVSIITTLAAQYEKLKMDTQHLTKEQLEVWETYLKPFPPHGLDMDELIAIWEKFEIDEEVSDEERSLADQWMNWFETHSLDRLPIKRCYPSKLINQAKRYCKIVKLNAPEVVQVNEAKRLAEDFVLYHCLKW